MKCNEVRTFLSQIAGGSVSTQVQQADLDFLSAKGYLSVMQKDEYGQISAEVSNLTRMFDELQKEKVEERSAEAALEKEDKRVHSIFFHFRDREEKESDLARLETARRAELKEAADVAAKDSQLKELIQKKSMVDRMVQYDGTYLSLTGLGVITVNDLNVRNYRVSDSEFSDFIEESRETSGQLRSIAENGNFHVSTLKTRLPEADFSQLWNVSIGLAKLRADRDRVSENFLLALGILQHFDSTIENKMMAAEIMTSVRARPSQSFTDSSEFQSLSRTLESLDHELRHRLGVPKQLSAGIASLIMFGRRYDGTYPTDRFAEFTRMTGSYESAAILSVINDPSNRLPGKFQSFRSMFSSWGYQTSEDTELSSAYLSISDLGPDEVKTKMTIIVDALKNYLEYPLVAAAILTSIPTFEANETLDLMEKAYSTLWSYATQLERSELVTLSAMTIHGIKNELVRELDPTAKITKTPVQFTHAPSNIFFLYRAPLIVTHHSYYSTFSGIGGYHPAHGHGVGGFGG